jgi:hypothetical protein
MSLYAFKTNQEEGFSSVREILNYECGLSVPHNKKIPFALQPTQGLRQITVYL